MDTLDRRSASIERPSAHGAAVLISTCLMIYYSSMPAILGRAADSLQLQEQQLGLLGGAFAIAVALASLTSAWTIRRYNWRTQVRVGAGLAAVAYLIPLWLPGFGVLVACHFAAGLFAGLGYSVTIACLGDSREPARNYALVFLAHTLTASAITALLPRLAIGPHGFDYALQLLAGMALAGLVLANWLPRCGRPDRAARGGRLPAPPAGVLPALVVILLIYIGDGAVWAFAERIGIHGGWDAARVGSAVAASLLMGALGSAMAGLLATRWGYALPMTVVVAASVLSVILLQLTDSFLLFAAALAINGWAWNFGAAYRMGLVAELDTSGRYTPLISTTQTLGASLGPMAAGALVFDDSFLYVYMLASACWCAALGLFLALLYRRGMRRAAEFGAIL